jgi:hypothetical protein
MMGPRQIEQGAPAVQMIDASNNRAFRGSTEQSWLSLRCFSSYLYKDRNLVERFFNKIKQCRRVATRYDKLAANYLAFVELAAIPLWLRALWVHELGRVLINRGLRSNRSRFASMGAFEAALPRQS